MDWISVEERLPETPYEDVLVYPRPTDYCCEAHINGRGEWLYGEGVKGEWDGSGQDDVAEFLQSVCMASTAGFEHPQYGAPFYQLMKRMALDRYNDQIENQY